MATDAPFTPQNAGPIPADDPAMQKAVERGHELTDVSVKGLFIFAGSLLIFLAAVILAMILVFKGFRSVDRGLDARQTRTEPGARTLVQESPDYQGPLLQVTPKEDLAWMKAHQAMNLSSYGWVNRQAGVVRLPIDRAIDLIAERGLPPVSPGLTVEAIQRQRADPQVWGQALRP
jgi:hypothetical protein